MIKKFILVTALLLCMNSAALAYMPEATIYRYYNRVTGEHLFTDSEEYGEWSYLFHFGGPSGWYREGLAWMAPRIGYGDPVFRLFNPSLNEHLYTKDIYERDELIRRGWQLDFSGHPAFSSGGSVPIYRLYNPNNGRHHLTTDINEYNTLPGSGWRQEGVCFTALKVGSH